MESLRNKEILKRGKVCIYKDLKSYIVLMIPVNFYLLRDPTVRNQKVLKLKHVDVSCLLLPSNWYFRPVKQFFYSYNVSW